ncbi:glutamyl tRNA reductase [Gammaproteobacteria bacterium]|nr:glutamyl tRNA reductase [Gammaproteobacteria bacterium]
MKLLVLGINHKTAPIEFRERVALVPEKCVLMLTALKDYCQEAVIVSTCNRTELYIANQNINLSEIMRIWGEICALSPLDLAEHLYTYHHEDSVKHLFRVASGLDSLVLGEPQILGQLKDAYLLSQAQNMLGKYLNHQFQYAFQVAKKVRTYTKIGAFTVSVAFTAVHLAKQIFENLNDESVLLVGAGETIELVARHLIEAGVLNIIIANRSLAHAHDLITRLKNINQALNIHAISLNELDQSLYLADILIASTGAAHTLILADAVKKALKKRKHKPMFMVDLAVPRDIDATVAKLDDIYLYDIDNLGSIVKDNQNSRKEAALQAEAIIIESVAVWLQWELVANHDKLIKKFIDISEIARQDALGLAQKQLANGVDPTSVIEQLSKQLSNKLNHPTLAALKTALREDDPCVIEFLQKNFTK